MVTELLVPFGFDAANKVTVKIDESVPMGRARIDSIDPIVLALESGAVENRKRLRQFGRSEAIDGVRRLLLQGGDRRDPVPSPEPQPSTRMCRSPIAQRGLCIAPDGSRERVSPPNATAGATPFVLATASPMPATQRFVRSGMAPGWRGPISWLRAIHAERCRPPDQERQSRRGHLRSWTLIGSRRSIREGLATSAITRWANATVDSVSKCRC